MRTKKIILTFALVSLAVLLNGCTYEEQPPKTTDSNSNYVLPAGEIPSAEEIDIVNAARMEYEDATN